ncbi:MAG: hypothetical protein ACK5DE_01995 [Bacteroidota bacterium]|jgi:hypothetical protein
MNKSQVDEILSKIKKQASAVAKVRSILPNRKIDANNNGIPDDEEEYVPVGVKGLLSASQKLLAINRGLDKPDERDSLLFKRILTTDRLLSERIKLDSDRVRGSMLPLIARHKNLKAVGPFAFDSYMEKFLIGNPLSSPLEEINPLHLLEQSRRATQMGPGGIGTDNAITEDMQAIRTDQFGFLSTLEGPESMPGNHFVYTKQGWLRWTEVNESTLFACNIDGKLDFHRAIKINIHPFEGELICAAHNNILMELTPHHRVYYSTNPNKLWDQYKVAFAEDLYSKSIRVPCWHRPYEGTMKDKSHFDLPGVGNVPIESFAALMGWILSEGSITAEESINSHVCISQSSLANPDCFQEIEDLLNSMGIKFTYRKYGPSAGEQKVGIKNGFLIYNPSLYSFLLAYIPGGRLCHEKGFPEELLEFSIHAREALLHALMQGDGRINKTHRAYCTTSNLLADGVERLMISLGYPCRTRREHDKRAHVKTMNYAVCQLKVKEKYICGKIYGHKKYPGKTYGNHWYKRPYNDLVYCATVPGSKLFVRGSMETQPYWTGNSEKIGIDVRLAWGSKIGSDGKPYQKFFNRRTGKYQWMSPEDLDGLTVKLPD